MGAPAVTWFCENGHMVLDVPHHHIAEDPKKCPICRSTRLGFEIEWGDPDYGEPTVPTKPIRVDKRRKTIHIPVYDVSKLFEEK